MSGLPQPDLRLTAGARAVAHVRGILRSFEQNQLIFCVTFLTLFLASIALKALTETFWTDIGAGLGLSGLAFSLLSWLFRGKPTKDQNRPASVIIADGNRIISANDLDPKEAAIAFKDLVQNRQILPPPHGEVVTTSGMQQVQLRAYTEAEKKGISEKFAVDIREHDEKLLVQLDELIRQSGAYVASLPSPDQAEPTPLATQAERTLAMPANG